MTDTVKWVAGVVAFLVIVGLIARAPGRVQTWLAQRAAWERQVSLDAVQIVSMSQSIAVLQHQNDSLRRQTARRDTVIRVVAAHLIPAASLPDTCRSALAGRDSLIGLQVLQVQDLTSQLVNDSTALVRAGGQVALLQDAIDSAQRLIRSAPVTPTFWQKITPELRWGPAALVAPDGTVHTGLAVVASFGFPL